MARVQSGVDRFARIDSPLRHNSGNSRYCVAGESRHHGKIAAIKSLMLHVRARRGYGPPAHIFAAEEDR